MPAKPAHRRSTSKKRSHDGSITASLAKLYDIGPYNRNEIRVSQIDRIREVMDLQGFERAAELVGVCQTTLLKIMSGFGHKLRPDTAAKVRAFLGESK